MWPFKPKAPVEPPAPMGPVDLPPQTPDKPVPFGYKITWWALKTTDTEKVAEEIELEHAQTANWETGVTQASCEKSIFITPPVNGWTMVVGTKLLPGGRDVRDELVDPLTRLSDKFGTALLFCTHRVVDYHIWAKAVDGAIVRGYGVESIDTLWDEGPKTAEEKELGFEFFDDRSPEAKEDGYWDREDLLYVGEEEVMGISKAWSVCPIDFEDLESPELGLGILGSYSSVISYPIEYCK